MILERWKITLYTVWFSQILSIMSFNFGIPFIPFYIQELGVVQPDSLKIYTGLLSMAPAVTMAVMAPIWGLVSDRWGRKLMLLRAMLCASVIIALMGAVSSVNQLVALRFIQGIFTGTVTASSALVASSAPSSRLTYALGFLSSSTFIGASAGPIIGGFLAELVGYRVSFLMGGILMLLGFVIVLALVKEEKAQIAPVENKAARKAPVFKIFSLTIISVLLMLVVLRVSRAIFSPYLPLYVQELLSSSGGVVKLTGLINGITGLATALAGLTLSRLGDRYDKTRLLIVFFAASMAASVIVPAVAGNLWLFTAAYGIFFFLIGGVEPVLISISAEKTPAERHGVLFGIQGTVGNIGFAVSPLLGGAISVRYSLRTILLLVPFTLIPGLISLFMLKRGVAATSEPSRDTEEDVCL
jgi:DHA1 family multidrug resistance protein-like MFS transporter